MWDYQFSSKEKGNKEREVEDEVQLEIKQKKTEKAKKMAKKIQEAISAPKPTPETIGFVLPHFSLSDFGRETTIVIDETDQKGKAEINTTPKPEGPGAPGEDETTKDEEMKFTEAVLAQAVDFSYVTKHQKLEF
jgi:hypothetical protein